MAKRFSCLLLVLLVLSSTLVGQTCHCQENFGSLVSKTSRNYIGYHYKVNQASLKDFNRFTTRLRNRTPTASLNQCFLLMQEWISWFGDMHTGISFNFDQRSAQQISDFTLNYKKGNTNAEQLRKKLSARRTDQLEGFWQSEDGLYTAGIENAGGQTWNAYILEGDSLLWHPGQLRFSIQWQKGKQEHPATYRKLNHLPVSTRCFIDDSTIVFPNFGTWRKSRHKSKPQFDPPRPTEPAFTQLNPEFALLTIPSFSRNAEEGLNSLLAQNEAAIRRSKLLIIDVRNNRGGVVSTYDKILPLLYTQPMLTDGSKVLASEDIIQSWTLTPADSVLPIEVRAEIERGLAKLKKGRGQIVQFTDPGKIVIDSPWQSPAQIAILTNGGTASAAELFVLAARQSKKVKVFGQNTLGGVDYLDLSALQTLPCDYFIFVYATSRRNFSASPSFDGKGIPPDVWLNGNPDSWIAKVIAGYRQESQKY